MTIGAFFLCIIVFSTLFSQIRNGEKDDFKSVVFFNDFNGTFKEQQIKNENFVPSI